jgi:hypothetical protein
MALDVRNTTPGVNPADRTAETGNAGDFDAVLAGEQSSQGDLIAFVQTVLRRETPIRGPAAPAGTQNRPIGVPPGHGQPTQPGYTPGSPGLGDPGTMPYVSPRPSAGLDGLIREGFGSRQRHEMLSVLDGMISVARDSADGRAMITVPVGNASNPQGYVNLTYDRNTGQLYTSDPTGRDQQLYKYVPLSNLLESLRLPPAGSDIYNDYKSLGLALENDGRVPAHPRPAQQQTTPPETVQPLTSPPQVQHDPAPTFTSKELRDRIKQFLPRAETGNVPSIYGTYGGDAARSEVAKWNDANDTNVAVALEVTYWDPYTKQEARTWVGYFDVNPKSVQNLIRYIDETRSFNVNNKDGALTDSKLSPEKLSARSRLIEDRAFAANLPFIGEPSARQMKSVVTEAGYQQSKATIAVNNAVDIAAGRIDQIDLIIPADNSRGAFLQDITRGNAVSLLNYARETGLLRDGVDLDSVVAANGLQDLLGVTGGRAVVKPPTPVTQPLNPQPTPAPGETSKPQPPKIPGTPPLLNPFPADSRIKEAADR